MKKTMCLVAFACASFSVPAFSADIITVTPTNPPSGQAQSPAPFTFRGTSGSRTQQVYTSSFFTGAQTLTSIAFRSTPGFRNAADYGNVIVRLSTTDFGDETGTPLSSSFADNIGANVATVFEGALSFGAPSSDDFEYVVNFSSGFLYDPTQGNLLLDVQIPVGASVSGPAFFLASFDVANEFNDGVFSVNALFDGNASIGTPNTAGTITRFTGNAMTGAIPEPATWAMMIAGFGIVGGALRRRRATHATALRA